MRLRLFLYSSTAAIVVSQFLLLFLAFNLPFAANPIRNLSVKPLRWAASDKVIISPMVRGSIGDVGWFSSVILVGLGMQIVYQTGCWCYVIMLWSFGQLGGKGKSSDGAPSHEAGPSFKYGG